ncbi:lysM and putative peptidoglycan-binding domain-containing protein 1 [Tachysurus fulvidraco]|uniref:lysM and putative peptidoglycan-binding domain-containing protein 1 n=1 Tax=Tachysurus fulvidraco TaxID=1234273 RepID=UPI001FEF78AA|nr:lysM and putative peptidoglycan-binding domain-containing protein 1 [Tachysurus fulvidraco]
MSADQTSVGIGAHGLLQGQRAKSYGSLVTSSVSPVRQKPIQHNVQPGETLQGLSLKYGVSMEQIKRANRLYTNDSIFLKKVLSIPILTESLSFTNENESLEDESILQHQQVPVENGQRVSEIQEVTADISPSDYLKRMDSLIYQSKLAAIKTCQEAQEAKFSSTKQNLYRRQQFCGSSPGERATLGSVPLTITKRTKKLRDREDEIFQL